jgi:hypothetical protein
VLANIRFAGPRHSHPDNHQALLEPRLDDGEIIIQVRRSAKMINMIQEIIHQASLPRGRGRQMCDASIQVPCITSIAEDFKDPVAEDEEAGAQRYLARLSWIFLATKNTHHHAGGRKKERILLAGDQHNRRGMPASSPSQRAVRAVVNAVPDGEEPVPVLFAPEGIVKLGEHLIGLLHVRFR